jgi:hypothetical protein
LVIYHGGKTINPLTAPQAAYIAGILDGEGCIMISRKNDTTGVVGGISYRPFVSVSNTDFVLLEWLKVTTGLGSVTSMRSKRPRERPSWRWDLWSQQAAQVIRAVCPYLVIKADQAALLLEFVDEFTRRNEVGRRGLSTDERAGQVRIYEALKTLHAPKRLVASGE